MYGSRDTTSPARAVADLLFPELAGTPAPPLVQGILRAPRRGRTRPPWLSAVPAATAADAPAGVATPEAVLAERGWEGPALLQRAAATRRALVAARVAGAWWQGHSAALPTEALRAGTGHAIVALSEPAIAGCRAPPSNSVLAAMLAAALAEQRSRPGDRSGTPS